MELAESLKILCERYAATPSQSPMATKKTTTAPDNVLATGLIPTPIEELPSSNAVILSVTVYGERLIDGS